MIHPYEPVSAISPVPSPAPKPPQPPSRHCHPHGALMTELSTPKTPKRRRRSRRGRRRGLRLQPATSREPLGSGRLALAPAALPRRPCRPSPPPPSTDPARAAVDGVCVGVRAGGGAGAGAGGGRNWKGGGRASGIASEATLSTTESPQPGACRRPSDSRHVPQQYAGSVPTGGAVSRLQLRVQQKTRSEYNTPPEAVRTGTPRPMVRPRIERGAFGLSPETGRFGRFGVAVGSSAASDPAHAAVDSGASSGTACWSIRPQNSSCSPASVRMQRPQQKSYCIGPDWCRAARPHPIRQTRGQPGVVTAAAGVVLSSVLGSSVITVLSSMPSLADVVLSPSAACGQLAVFLDHCRPPGFGPNSPTKAICAASFVPRAHP